MISRRPIPSLCLALAVGLAAPIAGCGTPTYEGQEQQSTANQQAARQANDKANPPNKKGGGGGKAVDPQAAARARNGR